MNLTQKETMLLKDMRSQEQICIEKYGKYSAEACDCQLKDLFNQLGQTEQQHLQTLDKIASGTIPQMGGGQQQTTQQTIQPSSCSPQDKQKDSYLCSDALSTEKHVSSSYNTCIFEFADPAIRDILNHIQKEEQQHGERIYNYMSVNGMYS
jgi:spore coat protein CotF